jgi:hypothetical protein
LRPKAERKKEEGELAFWQIGQGTKSQAPSHCLAHRKMLPSLRVLLNLDEKMDKQWKEENGK